MNENYYDELVNIFYRYSSEFEEDSINFLKKDAIFNFLLLTQFILIWIKAYNNAYRLSNYQVAQTMMIFMQYKTNIQYICNILNECKELSESFWLNFYRWNIFEYSIKIKKNATLVESLHIYNRAAEIVIDFVREIDQL